MVDIASLAIQIDTSDVARAENDLDRLGTKGAKAEQAAKGVGDAYQQASGKVVAVAGAASKAGTALERNSVAARENARELASVDRTASSLSGSMSKLGATLAGLTAGMSIKGIIDISDNYGQMADRIKMATASTEEYRMVQERLLQSANKTYRPLAEAQELYIRTADAIRSLGYQTKDALDITDSFSYLLVTNAASADKASNAIDAYSKSIQSGRIEVDSWQSLIAAMPSVVDTMSRSLGKSAEEIRQLGITGKLSLSDLNEGLRQTVDANQKLADGMGTTLNDALIRASNNMSTYLGESSKVTASSRLLSGALDGVTENIDLIASVLGGAAVAAITRYTVVTGQSTAASVAHAIAVRRQAAEELKLAQAQAAATAAAVAQARANVGLVGSIGSVTAATAAHEAAQKRLAVAQAATMGVGRSMLGLMGGPVGLIATVGLTALSFVEFGDKAKGGMDKAANATEQAAMRIRNATRNLLPSDIGTLSFDALQAEVVQVETELKSARDELERFQRNFDAGNISEQWLDKPRDKVAALEGALVKLKAEMDGVRFASDTAGQSYSKNLERQAVLVGKVTEEQRLLAMVQAGYIKLSQEDLALAIERAKRIDAVSASLKGSTGELKEQANAYQALYDRLYPAEAAQRKYTEEVDRLKTVLKGNELADAIDRLNRSIDGADATGPGDVIEDYRKELQRLEDQLDPVGKATSQYQKDVERLNDAMERGERSPERTTELLAELERQYKDNTRATSDWAKWTEGALDRVDSAFADAWRNIGDGFSSFRDSLTNAFKQMLAELAHMAITKPIIMQIGASLGIGGGTQGNNGIWGSLLGGGSGGGGLDFGKLLNYGQTAYSMFTGVGPAALAGYQSGGIMGGLQGAAGYYGNLASSAWGTVSGWLGGSAAAGAGSAAGTGFGYGQSLVSGQIGNAAYAGAQAGAGSSLSGIAGNLGAIVGPIAGLYMAIKGYGAISDGYDFKPKDFDDEFAGVRLGAKVINAYENGITKVFGDSSFLSKALRIPVATIGGLMSSVFGGGWETKNYGMAFSVANGDFLGQSYEDQKKKGGLFGSDKKRTKYRSLDPETAAVLQETYDATQAGVADLFASLSLTVEEGSLDGLKLAREKISTKGKTEEEIQQAIAEWFGSAADAMTAELNKVFNTGLDLDLEGMQAFVGNLTGVNEVLRYLDVEMYDASVSGGKLAEALSAAAGGLEALATNSQTYYDAFFSAEEKTADTIDAITRAFESADVELAASREAYRAMVEDIDLTTEAGQEMFATLMALSGQAAQYYSILEQQGAALIGAAGSAYAALQRSIANQQQEIQRAASSTASAINALTGVSNSLDAALKRLRGSSDDTVRMLRAQAVMTLNSALVTARAGGSLADYAGLQDALDVASNMDTSLYRSLEDFEREQGRTANLIAELEKVNGKQLTAEQRLLEKYDAQLSALDQQLVFAQSQLDALNGIDNSIMGVAAAIAAMNASVVAALQGLPKGAAQANTPQNNRSIIDTIYQSVLGRGTQGDEAGAAFWANALQTGTATYQDIAASIAKGALGNSAESAATKKSAEEYLKGLGIPGFASGGLFGGGLRIVGENGPELEVTGPSRIYNASQTASMLGGGGNAETVAELRQLRADIRTDLRSIAKHTMKTAKYTEYLEHFDADGLPPERKSA